jgi:catechol 2,3-dioxygenase-like lactoylglutathione lyase family enzyme
MAIVGGALRVIAAFIPYVPESPLLETLYAAIDLSLLFGLAAIYWPVSDRLGWWGAVGYAVATAGVASIVGPDPRMFELEFYMVGSAIFEIGLLVLAMAFFRQGISRPAAWLWIASLAGALIAVAKGGNATAFILAGIALGLGFMWAGFDAIRRFANPVQTAVQEMAFNQVTIGCTDLIKSIEFYQTLGFRLIVHSPENGYARFEAPNDATLSLHLSLPTPAGAVLYFEHPALDSWVKRLIDRGVRIEHMPADQSWGWREARVCDPSGNPLCFYWAGANRRFPPWRLRSALA